MTTWSGISVTRKKLPNVYKRCPKNDLTRNMIDFDTFTKIAWECGRFGQINCCQRLWIVAQSPKNCPIWSHWSGNPWVRSPAKDVSEQRKDKKFASLFRQCLTVTNFILVYCWYYLLLCHSFLRGPRARWCCSRGRPCQPYWRSCSTVLDTLKCWSILPCSGRRRQTGVSSSCQSRIAAS